MTDPRLYIWPRGAEVVAVKEIVQNLGLSYTVRPFWWTPEAEDVKRVLVLADGFDHGTLVDYIYPKRQELLKESIEWALGLRAESRGARLVQGTWDRIFGGPVKIREWEDVESDEPEHWMER